MRFFLSLSIFILSQLIYAAEKIDFILFDVAPYAENSISNKKFGVYVEIAELLGEKSSVPYSIELVPFSRLSLALEQNPNALSFSFETDSLNSQFTKISSLLTVESILLPRKDVSLNNSLDIKNKIIGRLSGGCKDLSEHIDKTQFFTVDNFESGLKMLKASRIDALCTTFEASAHYIKKLKYKKNDFGKAFVISKRDVFIYSNTALPEKIKQQIKKTSDDLKKKKAIQQLWNNYT